MNRRQCWLAMMLIVLSVPAMMGAMCDGGSENKQGSVGQTVEGVPIIAGVEMSQIVTEPGWTSGLTHYGYTSTESTAALIEFYGWELEGEQQFLEEGPTFQFVNREGKFVVVDVKENEQNEFNTDVRISVYDPGVYEKVQALMEYEYPEAAPVQSSEASKKSGSGVGSMGRTTDSIDKVREYYNTLMMGIQGTRDVTVEEDEMHNATTYSVFDPDRETKTSITVMQAGPSLSDGTDILISVE